MDKENEPYLYTPLPEPMPITSQQWPDGTVPLLSIICNTYNQEAFIGEAMEGFLMQQTTFPVEILVHDDASTDRTAHIVREYEKQHPGLILPIYQTVNQYSQGIKPRVFQFPRARGKYIAVCEGDDYWTHKMKLQRQVEFLENNIGYVICFHKVRVKKINGEIVDDFITKVPENHESIYDMAGKGNYIHTPSVVFKKPSVDIPDEFRKSPIGDFPLYVFLSQFGKIKYMEEVMAVYRHGIGVWSSKSEYYCKYNTAVCDSILFEYFHKRSDDRLSNIFSFRIKHFFTECHGQITIDEYNGLIQSTALSKSLFKQLVRTLNIQLLVKILAMRLVMVFRPSPVK